MSFCRESYCTGPRLWYSPSGKRIPRNRVRFSRVVGHALFRSIYRLAERLTGVSVKPFTYANVRAVLERIAEAQVKECSDWSQQAALLYR